MNFWVNHWSIEASSVRVADLVQELASEKYITEEMKETVLVCMYGLLTGKVIDLPADIAHYKITLRNFGNIIKWFGPLRQGTPKIEATNTPTTTTTTTSTTSTSTTTTTKKKALTWCRRYYEYGVDDANRFFLRFD